MKSGRNEGNCLNLKNFIAEPNELVLGKKLNEPTIQNSFNSTSFNK